MADTYKLIASQTLSSAAASITINSLPSTYKDLEIRVSARSSRAFDYDAYFLTLNGDSSTNYSYQSFYSQGSSSGADNSGANYTKILAGYATGASGTANTFSSNQILITNYAGSLHKAIKISSVEEYNSAAANYITTIASRYGSTSAITSLTLTMDGGRNFVAGSSIYIYGISAVGASEASTPTAKATGGTIFTDGTYFYHKFLSTGTFTPSQALTVDVAMVGGGGGGAGAAAGANFGGGGGGGSVGIASGLSLSSGVGYSAVVGAGGAGGASGDNAGAQGTASSFNSVTANRGGGGGASSTATATTGGSGGGGGDRANGASATAGSSSGWTFYANAGANSASTANGSGGGGGAGANDAVAAGNSAAQSYRSGGSALSVSTYLSNWNAGNPGSALGAGGGSNSPTIGSTGGTGGGSGGDYGGGTNNTAGAANYGGGGGGTGGSSPSGTLSAKPGKAGGSGIVVVRYPV